MTDEFLSGLRSTWHSQDVELSRLLARLRRQRFRPHLALAFEMLATVFTMGVGLWFASIAIGERSLLFAMSAGVLLLASPAMATMAWLARRDSLRWEEETAESVLVSGLRRAEASLKMLRLGRLHLVLIAAFVALLWAAELGGLIEARAFLVLYSLICAALAAIYLPWIAWRRKRTERERAMCRRLLEDLYAGDD